MNQKVVEGLSEILEDEQLSDEFMNFKTSQEAYEFAKPYLDGASFEEFENAVEEIVGSSKESLSLDNLDDVAGGFGLGDVRNAIKKVKWRKVYDGGKMIWDGIRGK